MDKIEKPSDELNRFISRVGIEDDGVNFLLVVIDVFSKYVW